MGKENLQTIHSNPIIVPKSVDISKMHEKVNDTSEGAPITLGEDNRDDEMKIETLVQDTISEESSSISKRCNHTESSDVQHEQRFTLFLKYLFSSVELSIRNYIDWLHVHFSGNLVKCWNFEMIMAS